MIGCWKSHDEFQPIRVHYYRVGGVPSYSTRNDFAGKTHGNFAIDKNFLNYVF